MADCWRKACRDDLSAGGVWLETGTCIFFCLYIRLR